MPQPPPRGTYETLLRAALEEDIRQGDCTTHALVSETERGTAQFLFRQEGILAGSFLAEEVFRTLDPQIEFRNVVQEGDPVERDGVAATVSGSFRALLTGERTALNFLQRLSGIASRTRRYVDAVRGTGAQILDTRKTTPGWRALEKYAVAAGGGRNHRFGLYDQVLIKDNHLEVVRKSTGKPLPEVVRVAVQRTRSQCPDLRIEVEVEDIDCFIAAVESGADIIMLDNRSPEEMRTMVEWLNRRRPRPDPKRPILEASGGITLDNVRRAAETGVDWISIGALTHSTPALDVSMEVLPLE